ncbi:MAG: Sugar-specific transcriptional regulator TrmB [Methanocella sp. PtaU1.Bin125]|nr:MAG: Sugar-specific transcriptional regulator TrmB [Methanocella sp. PtaU1.Bin125]
MDKKAVEALTSFGLTEYEAKVYLTLVMKGVQKASALADMSDIPRPHVYSVIKLLHEKGLIIIIPEKVTKYQALPLDTVLKKLLEERMDSIKSLESIGKELISSVQQKGTAPEKDEIEKVQLYSGRWVIVDLIHKMLGRATASCEIITNDKSFVKTAGAYEQDLTAAHKKGVKTRFLFPIEKDTLPMIEGLSPRATVRHLDSMENFEEFEPDGADAGGNTFLRVVVVDDTEVLFVRAQPGGGEESAIWTSQRELARMIRLMFRNMWRNAPDMAKKRIEIETGRKPEHLTPIYGDADMEKTLRMVLAHAEKELCCVLSGEQLVYNLNTLVTESRTLTGKGVKVMMLVSIRGNVNRSKVLASDRSEVASAVRALQSAGADVRHPLDESILLMVLNDDEVTFNLLGESVVSSAGGNIGVYTNHRDTIERIREYFERLWKNSVDASDRLRELDRVVSKEVMRDGEEGLKRYFERLSGLGKGHFAIESSDPERKTIEIICTDAADVREQMRREADSDICESVRGAFRKFGEFIYEGTKMACEETHCVSRGDPHCVFRLHPLEKPETPVGNDLLKFFESIKSGRSKEPSNASE